MSEENDLFCWNGGSQKGWERKPVYTKFRSFRKVTDRGGKAFTAEAISSGET